MPVCLRSSLRAAASAAAAFVASSAVVAPVLRLPCVEWNSATPSDMLPFAVSCW